jgi:hypothetical protein
VLNAQARKPSRDNEANGAAVAATR